MKDTHINNTHLSNNFNNENEILETQRKCALLDGTSRDAAERVCTVDEHNVRTSMGSFRSDMRLNNLWHRATYIIIKHTETSSEENNLNSDEEEYILVQKRSKTKDYCPNKLDPSPGGVVGFHETYLENAQRELIEEMNLKTYIVSSSKTASSSSDNSNENNNSTQSKPDLSLDGSYPIRRLFTFPYEDDRIRCWGDLYEVQYTGPLSEIIIQEEEVLEILSLSLTEIKTMIRIQPEDWKPDGLHALRLYLQYRHDSKVNRRFLRGYSSMDLSKYTVRPKPKVIFFDCDDCLYFDHWKTANQLTKKIEEWCTEKKGLPPGEAYALYKKYGTALKGLLVEKYIADSPEDIAQYLEEVHDIPIHDLISPDPKLRQMLDRLDPSIPKFIFTASVRHHAERCLKALGIDHLFPSDHIIDVMSCNLETKHCRESFEVAMRIANVTDPESCLFFDDSVKNIEMGREMGWRSVLVGKVGRDCGRIVGSNHAELEMNSIHDLQSHFPELFVD